MELFGDLGGEWRGVLPGVGAGRPGVEPKISKGEKYKGLPWVMLDYPRIFGKEDIMAIGTRFWWGHYFSVTLHLKGGYLRTYLPVILRGGECWRRRAFGRGFRMMNGNTIIDRGGDGGGGTRGRGTRGKWKIGDRPFLKLSARCELDQSALLRRCSGSWREY